MSFTRYEIRTYYERCFYEGGGDNWDYIPFESHKELIDYLAKNKDYQTATDSYVCKVTLYSDHDCCKKLATTKEYWELHQRGII